MFRFSTDLELGAKVVDVIARYQPRHRLYTLEYGDRNPAEPGHLSEAACADRTLRQNTTVQPSRPEGSDTEPKLRRASGAVGWRWQ